MTSIKLESNEDISKLLQGQKIQLELCHMPMAREAYFIYVDNNIARFAIPLTPNIIHEYSIELDSKTTSYKDGNLLGKSNPVDIRGQLFDKYLKIITKYDKQKIKK